MGTLSRRSRLFVGAATAVAGLALVTAPTAPADAGATIDGCGIAAHAGGDWTRYGADQVNSRNQPAEATIGPLEAATLAPVWTLSTSEATGGNGGDITGTPTVADGCVFVGTNGGWIVAANADTGEPVWTTKTPSGGTVNSSLTVDGGVVFASVSRAVQGDKGGSYLLALDAANGSVAWQSAPLDRQTGSDIYASPVLVDAPDGGRAVMVGISGGAAELGDESDRYAFQGSMMFVDADTGAILDKVWTIHPPVGEPGGYDDDFAGGTIWSTPSVVTLDDGTQVAYVGVGNPFKPWAEHEYTNAVVGYDVSPSSPTWGQIVGSYKGNVDSYFEIPEEESMPCYDIDGNPPPWYPQGAGKCFDVDLDFGASPNVWRDATSGRLLVGTGQKSGIYHVFHADDFSPAWTSIVGPGGPVGGIVGSTAMDGDAIYGPVTVPGYVWSIGLDGVPRWVTPLGDGVHWGNPVSVANGVVYTMDFAGNLNALDAATGAPLLKRPIQLGSDVGFAAPLSWAGVSIARNTVYAAVGMQGLPNGFVVAFRPDAPVPTSTTAAAGAGGRAVSGPGAAFSTYATPYVVVSQGESVTYTNLDPVLHDFDSIDDSWGDRPLIGIGQSDVIDEIATLAPGEYGFFCSLHPRMTGTLVVV